MQKVNYILSLQELNHTKTLINCNLTVIIKANTDPYVNKFNSSSKYTTKFKPHISFIIYIYLIIQDIHNYPVYWSFSR